MKYEPLGDTRRQEARGRSCVKLISNLVDLFAESKNKICERIEWRIEKQDWKRTRFEQICEKHQSNVDNNWITRTR